MSRLAWFRAYAVATITVAVATGVWAVAGHALPVVNTLLFFALLIAVALYLRVEEDPQCGGFEAAVIFAAVPLLHDPAVALFSAFAGALVHNILRDAGARRLRLASLLDAAQLALSYGVVAMLYCSAVAVDAPMMARVSGYVLLLVGYLVVNLAFRAARRLIEGAKEPVDVRQLLLVQSKMLLMMTPIVAVEVMSYRDYGLVGFAVAFLPVTLLAYALRSLDDAKRHNADLGRRNRELSILTESASQILSAEGDEETLRRMVTLLGRLSRLKACAAVTWGTTLDATSRVYRFGACLPTDQDVLRWVELAGFAQSAPSRAFVFQNEQRRFPLSEGQAIQVLIGIQTAEVIYGVLIYETEDATILRSGSLNLLMLIVNQTALSLQDQLLRREMTDKNAQLVAEASTKTMILEVANGLIGSFDVGELLTLIAKAVRASLGFNSVVFALRDPKRDEFIRRAHVGLDEVWEEMRRRPVSRAEIERFFDPEFRVLNSFFVSHTALQQSEQGVFVRHDEPLPRAEEWHENDILIVPLSSGDEMIGYLAVRDPEDRRVPSLEKVQTLEIFAVQAVTALQSARQYEEIKRLTFIDGLTPAYNHRYFQEAIAKEIHRHERTGHDFALAMLDIDNFKWINDTFGHPIGDEILKGIVDELMANARDTDVVSRYGGEEFAIIFPDTPIESARDAAERMLTLVERREFPIAQISRTLRVTVSIGVAVFPHDGRTATDLVARADNALYFAKKNGKNQVAMAGELGEAGEARA
jgi:diguanylate cyclase (GGDEF)-like protein